MEINNIKKTTGVRTTPWIRGDFVLYKDRIFELKGIPSYFANPSKRDKFWVEHALPIRTLTDTSAPKGIKFLGDRWYNPTTGVIYVYTKNQSETGEYNYIWLAS